MTDTPSSILLLRLQSVGSNVNLWGGYLNTALQTIERASKGYQQLAVTASATISWTNYSANNDGSVSFLKLTGPISSAATLTFPGYQHYLSVWNSTGSAVTIKCFGGTGVTLQNGDRALLYCDATDYYNAAPTLFPANLTITGAITLAGQIHGLTAGSANTDAVNKLQMEMAIAVLAGVISGGLVLNSSTDPSAGYLANKITSTSAALAIATTNAGTVNEKSAFAVEGLALATQAEQTAGFTAVAGNLYPINLSAPAQLLFPASATRGDKIGIMNYGTALLTFNWNGLKYNSATTSKATNAKGVSIFHYTGATVGWLEL